MSTKDTHLIPSDLALAIWSLTMLVNGQMPLCCFVARLQSHTFVIFNSLHLQSATRQVRLDSLTYFQLLFPAPSSVWNLTRNRLELCSNISNTHTQLFLWLQMWTTCFFYCAVPTPWGFNRSSSNIIDWQFSRLSRFSTNGISLRSDEAEMKILQRSGQAHFLGACSPDSFPPDRFALRRSRVWLKGELARRLS